MKKKRTLGVFWRSYIILCAVLLVLLVALTAFFYDYIKAFETGRPEYAVKEYVSLITKDDIISSVSSALDGALSGYEAEGAVSSAVSAALEKNGLSYVRAFSDDADAIPKYDVYCGEKLFTLTLAVTSGGKYGFENYTVTGADVADEWLNARKTTVSIIVPSGAETTVNGKTLLPDRLVETFSPETVSEFEKDSFALNMYEIADVFGDLDARSTLGGEKLPLDNPSAGVYTSVFDSVDSVYTVIAPKGAAVTVNGIALTDKYITGIAIPTDAHTFESETDVRCDVYSVKGLRLIPTVSAMLDGVSLQTSESEIYDSAFIYPDSYKKTYTVTVPDGAILYCNGVSVGDEYKTGSSELYPLPDSAKKYASSSEYGIEYAVTGLYAEPKFTASYSDGAVCVGGKTEDGWNFYPQASGKEIEGLEAVSKSFTVDYIDYFYEGWKQAEENYNTVIGYTKNGSAAYKTLKGTYDAMKYSDTFKLDKLEMKVYDSVKYSSDCYGIKVYFDSHGTYYKYDRTSVGTYTMIWVIDGGEWSLVELIFD